MGSHDDAFRTFAVDPPYAARTIRGKINRRLLEMTERMTNGTVKSWDDYSRTLGRIDGLRDALVFCEEMEKEDENERRARTR